MQNKVIAIISRQLHEDVAPGTKLHEDTYLDSLDYAELSIALEDKFRFEARWSEWDELFRKPDLTVLDIVSFVQQKASLSS